MTQSVKTVYLTVVGSVSLGRAKDQVRLQQLDLEWFGLVLLCLNA